MAHNEFNGIVVGIVSSEVNTAKKTVKVRIPQYHGLPGNPTEYKTDNYVEDNDLPDAIIMSPIGMSISSVKSLLEENTLVYVQFSENEASYPIITGWVSGSLPKGNTYYMPPSDITGFNAQSTRNTYRGNTYTKLAGTPGSSTPNEWFSYPFATPYLNWGFEPYDPFNTGRYYAHGGIDLGGVPGGYPLYAICDGTVQFIYTLDNSMGNSVWFTSTDGDPNGSDPVYPIQIQYMHMDSFAEGIAVGQTLHKGDLVGYIGTTGSSTGVHLHLGIRYTSGKEGQHVNEYRDPARVMGITEWQSPYEWYSQQPGIK